MIFVLLYVKFEYIFQIYLNRKTKMSQDGSPNPKKSQIDSQQTINSHSITADSTLPVLKQPSAKANLQEFILFDQITEPISVHSVHQQPVKEEVIEDQKEEDANPKKEDSPIIEQVEKQWIIKQAERQRIGGTYDFFYGEITKYGRHMIARKGVLLSIYTSIDQFKESKAKLIILLKEYFKDYASICEDFHERSYKYDTPQRQQSESIVLNLRAQLKAGFDRLINLRKNTGNDMSRLEKVIKETVIAKIDKAIIHYWGSSTSFLGKAKAKEEHFFSLQKKFIKRIDKITRLYTKGRFGTEIEEDLFIEMTKFVRQERQLRGAVFQWSREIYALRKSVMNADYTLIVELQNILSEYKNFNNTIYQLQKKKSNFIQRLKEQIQASFSFEKLCTPLDNDYILGIVNFLNRSSLDLIRPKDYEEFLNQEYFGDVIGDMTELLKGTLVKSFPLKFQNEELVRTVSGNLIYYSKDTLQTINKFKVVNTTAEFEGQGCVSLDEFVKGIIFDSHNKQKIYFKDDNRAEELVLYMQTNIGVELA